MVVRAGASHLSLSSGLQSQLSETPRIQRIVNHDIMRCTAPGVNGNFLYSGRALGITRPGDLIQLSPPLKSQWTCINAHYARIRLEHTSDVVWNCDPEKFQQYPDFAPSVFFFGEREHRSHQNREWYEVVSFINSKNNFMELAEQLGVPVPKTVCLDRADRITPQNKDRFIFPCYIKAAISVSGVGIYRCETPTELIQAARTFKPSTPIQIQQEVRTDCFLNMQYEVVNGECRRLLTSEQILDGPAHQGNLFPPRTAPWEIVDPMAEWLVDRGMQGVFAFDVAVIEEEDETRFLAIECNPRYNGASYPTAIAQKLDIQNWQACNYDTRHRSLDNIDLSGLEYDDETGEGVIIVNWGPVLVGKIMVMLAGSTPVREKLEMELKKRLW